MKLNNKELYLLIADTITAVKNDNEAPSIDELVEALAEAFKGYDPDFDKVQFLNDAELAEAL
jgi:hypothetical protein